MLLIFVKSVQHPIVMFASLLLVSNAKPELLWLKLLMELIVWLIQLILHAILPIAKIVTKLLLLTNAINVPMDTISLKVGKIIWMSASNARQALIAKSVFITRLTPVRARYRPCRALWHIRLFALDQLAPPPLRRCTLWS